MSTYKDNDTHYTMFRMRGIYSYYCYDPITNKRYSRSCGTRNIKEARAVIAKRLAEGKLHFPSGYNPRGKANTPRYSRKTFGELTENYFIPGKCPIEEDMRKRGKKISLSSMKEEETVKRTKILPYWKNEIPRNITPQMCDRFLLSMPELYGVSRTTSNHVFSVFRRMLEQLKAEGYITQNPTIGIKPLASDSKAKEILTVDELQKILSVEWPSKITYLAVKTAALTGMRVGEVRALKGCQINGLSIIVNASFSPVAGRKETKTYKSREIPITQSLKDELAPYIKDDDDYIFTLDGKKPVSVGAINNHLKNAVEKAGISKHISSHCLRHGMNTMLIAHNISSTIVQAAIGHSSDAMTEHYLHLKANDMKTIREVQEEIEKRNDS